MTSTRLILVFLGIIFLIIVVLAGRRISTNLKNSLAGLNIPGFRGAQITLTPTPTVTGEAKGGVVPTMTPVVLEKKESSDNGEIPATGANEIAYFVISGGLIGGAVLRKVTGKLRSRI